MPTALITGIAGQDGSYLAEFLLGKGYHVAGVVRGSSTNTFERISHLMDRVELVSADLLDQASLVNVLEIVRPDEVYNLAGQSLVHGSWNTPVLTGEFTALGVARMLEAVRTVIPNARFYQAGTSEQFGAPAETPQRESTPFHPRSPYGVAKVYGHWMTVNYREYFQMFSLSGILFNHESPRRGVEFVTRKITDAAARISLGLTDHVSLGDLEARRDWGFAGDYVRAMWLMLQQDHPIDFVIGTGATHSVRELCEIAFNAVGLDYRGFVRQDPKLVRKREVSLLVADPALAKSKLGWKPEVSFPQLVKMMVDADVERLSAGERA